MKTTKRATKSIIAASGNGWQIVYARGEGYSVTLDGRYIGSRDRLTDALELVHAQRLADAALDARLLRAA